MSIFEDLMAEVGEPLALATLYPQPSPAVMLLQVNVPQEGRPPKRLLVGKCLGRATPDETDTEVSEVGQMVIDRLTAAMGSRGKLLVVLLDARERVRQRVEVALRKVVPPDAILFVTPDERILAQLSWLCGLGLGAAAQEGGTTH